MCHEEENSAAPRIWYLLFRPEFLELEPPVPVDVQLVGRQRRWLLGRKICFKCACEIGIDELESRESDSCCWEDSHLIHCTLVRFLDHQSLALA